MTPIALRLFYEKLLDRPHLEGGVLLPSKLGFCAEAKVQPQQLNRILYDNAPLSKQTEQKLLKVMRKYGFPG